MSNRLYVVEDGDVKRLVKASSRALAVSFVVRGKFKVHPASALEAADLIGGGMAVEDSTLEAKAKAKAKAKAV